MVMPTWLLNDAALGLFNQLYYAISRSRSDAIVPMSSFFYPLDYNGFKRADFIGDNFTGRYLRKREVESVCERNNIITETLGGLLYFVTVC